MKAAATPWPDSARSAMAAATHTGQTTTPVGTSAAGDRHARDTSQPTTRPTQKGQTVRRTPAHGQSLGVGRPAEHHEDEEPGRVEAGGHRRMHPAVT